MKLEFHQIQKGLKRMVQLEVPQDKKFTPTNVADFIFQGPVRQFGTLEWVSITCWLLLKWPSDFSV